MSSLLDELQQRLGYRFSSQELLLQALTHRSYGSPHNERMEFLGDAILDMLVGESLYRQFPEATEGELSHMRAQAVCGASLAEVGLSLGLGECLRMGAGEKQSGGSQRQSTVANALEAVIAAVYLDGGLPVCENTVAHLFSAVLSQMDPLVGKDAKTRLQERLQARQLALPHYRLLARSGRDHEASFHVECDVANLGIRGDAMASSRKKAEQLAAEQVLLRMDRT